MWQLLTGGIGGIIEGGFGVVKTWLEGRQKKAAAKAEIQTKIIMGEVDYNIAAQQGMASSWKDEWLTIWTTAMITCCFIPKLQPYMEDGFKFLKDSTPEWFTWCFVGMYIAVFGLKGWKMVKNGG